MHGEALIGVRVPRDLKIRARMVLLASGASGGLQGLLRPVVVAALEAAVSGDTTLEQVATPDGSGATQVGVGCSENPTSREASQGNDSE